MLSLLGLTFLPSAFEIDQGLEKFQNPYKIYIFFVLSLQRFVKKGKYFQQAL